MFLWRLLPDAEDPSPISSCRLATFASVSARRNDPCPCGSGAKYKRCCLAEEKRAGRAARFDDAVGRRIQDFSSRALGDEISAALEQFVGPGRTMDDDDLQLFTTWFHNDRELPGGGTPAGRYAVLADLPDDERAAASRIAAARLGVHRVLAVEPGSWIGLEDVVRGTRARVRSPNVSRDAVRWDILLGRVMDGEPPSLWGPTRFFEPRDEPELLAELERLASAGGGRADEAGISAVLRSSHALELMRFTPSSRSAEPSFFTLEGSPVAHARATWHVHDVSAARARLQDLADPSARESESAVEVDITLSREQLVEDRPPLPPGAIVIEAGALGSLADVPIASLRLEGAELQAEAMSEERLDHVIEIVGLDFGDLTDLADREVVPIEQRLQESRSEPRRARATPPDLASAEERRLLGGFMTDRMRRWLDEPQSALDGQTPREAASGERRAEVVRLVRGIENSAERARRRGKPAAELAWLRGELGVEDELAA